MRDINVDKVREFLNDVNDLANTYGVNYFIVTDGASRISNNGNEAVKSARDAHIKWELDHGHDPYEEWDK